MLQQPLRHPLRLFSKACAVFALALLAAGCSSEELAPAPAGFVFSVDPAGGLVSLGQADSSSLSPQSVLTSGVDLAASYVYRFEPDNVLVIEATFTNLLSDMSFAQPFFFTVDEATTNILSSEEPEVTDDDLGGDGVLEPGETTSVLTFRVRHKGEPFVYAVNADAVRTVREVGFTQNDVIAFVSRYVAHVVEVGFDVADDVGVRALLAPLTELEGELPEAPSDADCGATVCLPRGVFEYGEGAFGGWAFVAPADELELRYEVADEGGPAPAVLVIDWDAGGPTLVRDVLPDGFPPQDFTGDYTYEAPTAPALLLTVDGESAAALGATLSWGDDCGLTGVGLNRFALNGSVGVDATARFDNVGFVQNNGSIGFTGATTLSTGEDAATFGGFVELGFAPLGEDCTPLLPALDRAALSLNTSVRVNGVSTRLGLSLDVSDVATEPVSAGVNGLLRVNDRLAVSFVGTLDDENGNGVPGENVLLSFADDSVVTLEALIGRFIAFEGLSTLLRPTR